MIITLLAPLVAEFALQFGPPKLRGLLPRLLQLRRHEQGAADQDGGRDDDRLRARRRSGSTGHRPAPADLRHRRVAHRLRLPDRGDRAVRDRRNPADDGGGAELPRRRTPDRSPGGAPTWAELPRTGSTSLRSCVIGCWMGITPAGATPASFMSYGVAKRIVANGQEFGTGRIEGVIAPETAAHAAGTSRAAADAGARRARLADRGRAARRPDDLGPPARPHALRRAEGIRLGPDRLHVSRQHRRPPGRAGAGALFAAILRMPFSHHRADHPGGLRHRRLHRLQRDRSTSC